MEETENEMKKTLVSLILVLLVLASIGGPQTVESSSAPHSVGFQGDLEATVVDSEVNLPPAQEVGSHSASWSENLWS